MFKVFLIESLKKSLIKVIPKSNVNQKQSVNSYIPSPIRIKMKRRKTVNVEHKF